MIVRKQAIDERKISLRSWAAHEAQAILVLLAAITTGVAWLMSSFYTPIAVPLAVLQTQVIPALARHISPEPVERVTFGLLAVCIPILAAALVYWVPRHDASKERLLDSGLLPLVVAVLLTLPFFHTDFLPVLFGDYPKMNERGDLYLLSAFFSSALLCFFLSHRSSHSNMVLARGGNSVAWLVFAVAAFLQLLSWRLVGLASVTADGHWSTHADPIFYVLSQVALGKTVLVDLPSQYGLFPEFMAPLLRLTGVSVTSVVVIFAAMQITALAAVFFLMTRLMKSRLITSIAGLALVLVTFETVIHLAGIEERYFQYWPIRFFWPAMSAFGFYFFARQPSYAKSCIMSMIGVVAMLWNFDSGLFVQVAFTSYLLARLIIRPSRSTMKEAGSWLRNPYLLMIGIQIFIAIIGVAAIFSFMFWKAGEPLNYRWIFEYQRIFVSMGLMMLPLPTEPHPWMSFLAVYLIGMVVAFAGWRRGETGIRLSMLFFLGMLGLGLFVYYVGRSHILNLVTVCWPAVIITGILIDEMVRAIRGNRLPWSQLWIPIAGLSLITVAAMSFIKHVPLFIRQVSEQYSSRNHPGEPIVLSELAFIKKHSATHPGCYVLSLRQGIYSAEAQLVSPLRGPGRVEILLKSDEEALAAKILRGSLPCIFLGVGPQSRAGLNIPRELLLEKYNVEDVNDLKTIEFLVLGVARHSFGQIK
jgi:hypothetical protein